MGKQPPCQDGESKVYHSDMKCSYLPERYLHRAMKGWLYTLQSNQAKVTANLERQSTRLCSLREWGCVHTDPLKKQTFHLTINRGSHQTYSKLIMTVVHMRELLYHKS